MSTSGTTAFSLDLGEIIEEAFERCGSEVRSGYDFRTARRSLNLLLLDWANRGVNLWTVAQSSVTLVQGTATYTMPTDCVDLIEHVIRTNSGVTNSQADLNITRISVSTYATIPNKLVQARPIQLYVDRAVAAPAVTVWPVPDGSTTYTLVYWYLRRMQDAGNGANTEDIPFRMLPALVAGLSYYLSMKVAGADARMPVLKQVYDEVWQMASDEDRDKASVRFVPRQSFIS
jgi:hypothetical protein